jgi:prevent-host-death family protein
MEINVYAAKTQLSRLLERVEAGEEIIITRHGRPVARLGPVRPSAKRRTLGLLRGKSRVKRDFDEPLPENVMRTFEKGIL